jgi:hypothetical protein
MPSFAYATLFYDWDLPYRSEPRFQEILSKTGLPR